MNDTLSKLNVLLVALRTNPFYAGKLAGTGLLDGVASLAEFSARCPFTTKAELVADQLAHTPYGTNLTFPLERYTRCHQTSGSTGRPLRWLDTPESWTWMLDNWETVHRKAGTTAADRIFFAFSFGPFLGFWTAFESAQRLGCLVFSGGGMTSVARLQAILDLRATVLCCTPTYAIHLAEVAAKEGIDLRRSRVTTLSVAGEPGGSIPATRARLAELWPGARVYDHHGMTEVGPVSYGCPARPGVLHVIERAFIAEVVNPATGQPVGTGGTGELILTNLGRTGSPLLRYRTGDLVQLSTLNPQLSTCPCGSTDLALEGGILGRVDDMIVVRGVNVYPSAVEEIIRRTGGVAEYQVRVSQRHALTELIVTVELAAGSSDCGLAGRLAGAFEASLALRVPVVLAEPGSLPRFESKARRWVREPG
ncbi:MAG: AMP-binding protein [Verrucomicrobia bacterium]|nr:AMP-binding protein [Verrucomicrobiota bacterium]